MAKQILSEEFRRMQKLAGIITESSAFNDAGEPMMTHNQFRDYSEPSEDDDDIFVETFDSQEYFIRCRENEDFMIYFIDDETIEIYDTKKNNGQKQEFGYQDAIDYVLKNKEHLLTFDESVRERNQEFKIDAQDRKNNRAEMGGYGLG